MIKNIVFDVGNVLVDFRYRDYMRDLGFTEETVEYFSENVVNTEYWTKMDNGYADIDVARHYFGEKMPQYGEENEKFWDNIEDIVAEYDYSEELIKYVRSLGFIPYALSNYPLKLSEMHWPKFRFLPFMEGYIISAKEKLIKPDPAIYRLLESRFGLNLSECAFVDDRSINVEAAEGLGMGGILFEGEELLKKKLLEMKYDITM